MADSIITKVGMNDSAFHAGVGRIKSGLNKLKGAFAGLGSALTVGGLVAMGKSSLRLADDISTAASTIGVTTDYLQELQYAAEQSGIGIEKSTMALQRFSRRLADAQAGGGELLPILNDMGIALRDEITGEARSAGDVMNDFADSLMKIKDPQEQLRAAFKAFDSEGAQMLVMLKKGSKELTRLRKEAHDAGAVMDSDLIGELDKADKALKKVARQAKIKMAEWTGAIVRASKISGAALDKVLGAFKHIWEAIKKIALVTLTRDLSQLKGAVLDVRSAYDEVTTSIAEAIVQVDREEAAERRLNKATQERTAELNKQLSSIREQRKEKQKLLETKRTQRGKLTEDQLAGVDVSKIGNRSQARKIQAQQQNLALAQKLEEMARRAQERGDTRQASGLFVQSERRRRNITMLQDEFRGPNFKLLKDIYGPQAGASRVGQIQPPPNTQHTQRQQQQQQQQSNNLAKMAKNIESLVSASAPNGQGLSVVPKMPNR